VHLIHACLACIYTKTMGPTPHDHVMSSIGRCGDGDMRLVPLSRCKKTSRRLEVFRRTRQNAREKVNKGEIASAVLHPGEDLSQWLVICDSLANVSFSMAKGPTSRKQQKTTITLDESCRFVQQSIHVRRTWLVDFWGACWTKTLTYWICPTSICKRTNWIIII